MKLFIFSLLISTIFGRTIMLNPNIQYEIDEQLEDHTKNFMENNEYEDIEEIEIPMIFHVIYNNDNNYQYEYLDEFTINQTNIQQDVVDQLNKDYNLENEDRFDTPEIWQELMADFKIKFFINKVIYINGYNKCVYKNNKIIGCDELKFNKNGGSDVIDPELNLNVWIIYIEGYLNGYAYYASYFKQQPKLDGYVLNIKALKERTSTHEIGHWMNLIHIWGNGKGEGDEDECNNDDGINDTPKSNTNHIDCGVLKICTYPETSSCGSPDMFMNYMSYGTERYMFTKDQMLRARAVFAEGGPRHSIVTQKKPDNSHEDIFLIILGIAAILSIVFLTCLIIRSLIRCCILKYQLREMENLEEEIHNAEIP
jgi:hypothetical protein